VSEAGRSVNWRVQVAMEAEVYFRSIQTKKENREKWRVVFQALYAKEWISLG
jgi:hypothetical protein